MTPLRLAQLTNYMGPSSGGLGIVVKALGEHHLRRGGQRLLIMPGPIAREEVEGADRRVTVASPALPGSALGHHVLLARRPVEQPLERFGPDLLEIHDQTTLAWASEWAERRKVPCVLFAHEQLSVIAREVASRLPTRWTDATVAHWTNRLTTRVDAVVCASDFAAAPLRAAGARNVHVLPFGVDLETFHPAPRPRIAPPWSPDVLRLICVGRLYPEKDLDLSLDTLALLRAQGVVAELLLIGSGPMGPWVRTRIDRERLPAMMLDHVRDRARVAQLTAAADVAFAFGYRETFGLSVLEAMASGTPVVVSDRGASRELLTRGAGEAVADAHEAAAATLRLARDASSGARARRRAECFSWAATMARIDYLHRSLMEDAGAREAVIRSG